MLGNSWVAERLVVSQEGLSNMDQGTGEDIRRDKWTDEAGMGQHLTD
jgi:hypothetical protein